MLMEFDKTNKRRYNFSANNAVDNDIAFLVCQISTLYVVSL